MRDDRQTIATQLRAAPRLALFLDWDGTLVPIVALPDEARGGPEVVALLERLARHPKVALLAIVSGRTIATLRAFIGRDIPGLSLVGTHGAEIAPAGAPPFELYDRGRFAARLDALRARARELADPALGFVLEDKGVSIAFHHRLAPPGEGERRAAEFARFAQDPLFEILPGKKVLEVRPRGVNKGAAVLALLAGGAPRAPRPLPAYFGDDLTDEDAFRALAPLEGATVLVARDPRGTAARWRVDDSAAVGEILRDL